LNRPEVGRVGVGSDIPTFESYRLIKISHTTAAVRYRIAVGPIAGRKTMTLHGPGAVYGDSAPVKVLTAASGGFSLKASVPTS